MKGKRIITLHAVLLLLNFGSFTSGKRAPSFDRVPKVS
jgi:hypothetical protein